MVPDTLRRGLGGNPSEDLAKGWGPTHPHDSKTSEETEKSKASANPDTPRETAAETLVELGHGTTGVRDALEQQESRFSSVARPPQSGRRCRLHCEEELCRLHHSRKGHGHPVSLKCCGRSRGPKRRRRKATPRRGDGTCVSGRQWWW